MSKRKTNAKDPYYKEYNRLVRIGDKEGLEKLKAEHKALKQLCKSDLQYNSEHWDKLESYDPKKWTAKFFGSKTRKNFSWVAKREKSVLTNGVFETLELAIKDLNLAVGKNWEIVGGKK